MTFIDQRLPEEIEIGCVRRENADHDISKTDGGYEVRNARQSQDLLAYDVSFPTGEFAGTIIAAVKAMVKASRIGLYAFRLRDWDPDMHQLTLEPFGTGNAVTTAFQLKKSWTVAGVTASRKITRPVSALQIFKDGVLQVSGYSVNYSTGIVTFSPAPGNGVIVQATGLFDIPARFDLHYSATAPTAWLEHIDTLQIIEVRE